MKRMVKTMLRSRCFFINGIILTATSLLLRGVGVAFGAFVTGKMGADGMGLYTLIMSVYGLAVTAASAGVNLAATRLCAEAVGTGSTARLRAALRRCLGWALLCGCSGLKCAGHGHCGHSQPRRLRHPILDRQLLQHQLHAA
jgi:stage V sporulation protein B